MADIVPVTAQVICAAVFETGHSKSVWTEMNSEVGQTVETQLPPLPVFDDRHSLDQATFDATETRLLTHFHVIVARFGPGGSARERRAWVSSIKLKYRNARRPMFAQAMPCTSRDSKRTHTPRAQSTPCSGCSWGQLGPSKEVFFKNV
jgi:hypothetical protein